MQNNIFNVGNWYKNTREKADLSLIRIVKICNKFEHVFIKTLFVWRNIYQWNLSSFELSGIRAQCSLLNGTAIET